MSHMTSYNTPVVTNGACHQAMQAKHFAVCTCHGAQSDAKGPAKGQPSFLIRISLPKQFHQLSYHSEVATATAVAAAAIKATCLAGASYMGYAVKHMHMAVTAHTNH
jgi:hypothetical protein